MALVHCAVPPPFKMMIQNTAHQAGGAFRKISGFLLTSYFFREPLRTIDTDLKVSEITGSALENFQITKALVYYNINF